MKTKEYRTSNEGSLHIAGLTAYTGPLSRRDSHALTKQEIADKLDVIKQKALKMLADLTATQALAEADSLADNPNLPDASVLDSRGAKRSDADDPDLFIAQQTRIAQGKHIAARPTQSAPAAPTGRADSAVDDGGDYDPAIRMQHRVHHNQSR